VRTVTRREALALATMTVVGGRSVAADAPKLTLSTFAEEITCPIGHPLMGGGIAPAKEIADPLFAHGFVLRGAGKPVAVVALDWCEVRNDAYDLWRTEIATAIGTDPVRVMLCCLHQHDAPIADLSAEAILRKNKCAGSICDPEFVAKAAKRVAGAAKASLAKESSVTHLGTGQAKVHQVASNRRYLDDQRRVRYDRMSAARDEKVRAADEGDIDPHLKTLSFWNGDTPLLAVSAYATHPMSYYGRGGVSADFVGLARKLRQAEMKDVPQIYLSGCSGNVTAGKYNDGDPKNRPVLAERLLQAMNEAWKATEKVPVREAAFRSTTIKLAARDGEEFSEAGLMKRLTTDPRPFGQCLAALGLSWRKRVEAGTPVDLPVLDFGSAVLTVLPAEAYVEYQLFAQAERKGQFVVVAGYGECGPGYIPIERAWKERDSNLTDWCWVPPDSQMVMEAAIRAGLTK
jgi:hypothetical protein